MLILKTFLVVYVIWNVYVFMAMGRDKRRAKRHQWRIPEERLLFMGMALGGIGLYAGMKYFQHKTAHSKFAIGAPLTILGNFLVIYFLYFIGHYQLSII